MGLVAVLAWTSVAVAQTPDARAAMTRTVLDQLDAFRRGDWAAAYAHASGAIRGRFGIAAFQEMVTRGYAPIARSARATVTEATVIDAAHGFVEVRVEGADGETVDALYELVDERGQWRINGVLTRPVERGVTAAAPSPGAPGPVGPSG
jgi:hypothetical protein